MTRRSARQASFAVERWILAALRNRAFFSLSELNEAIGELLERLNSRKFAKINASRRHCTFVKHVLHHLLVVAEHLLS